MSKRSIETPVDNSPSPTAIRAELAAILSSSGFKKSERQSRFLRFVCEAVLNGEGSKLNEYLIAQAVFDRSGDYSPTEDSIVRRQAYSVRQKLQEYYSAEGKWDAVRIGIPVGRYIPIFTTAVPEQEPSPLTGEPDDRPQPIYPSQLEPDRSTPARRRFILQVIGVAVVLIVSSFALGWRLSRTSAHDVHGTTDAALTEIWGDWLTSPQKVVFCFSNPLLAQLFTVREPLSDKVIPNLITLTNGQIERIERQLDTTPGSYMYLLPLPGTNAKMGEALGTIRMATFFTQAGISVRATQSRLFSWEDFRNENVVLLGHTESNRWLDPILSKLPLRLGPWQADKPTRVINANPVKGEPAEYNADGSTMNGGRREAYALISMIDGLDGRHQLLLINGLSTEGTEIAQELLTDAVSARKLLRELRAAAPGHSGPWHFQMLLKADVHANVPTVADLVTVRVLDNNHHL